VHLNTPKTTAATTTATTTTESIHINPPPPKKKGRCNGAIVYIEESDSLCKRKVRAFITTVGFFQTPSSAYNRLRKITESQTQRNSL